MVIGKKIRFNKLYEHLEDYGMRISKPTLSLHLKHLESHELLIRRVEEVQKVSYEINYEKIGSFGKKLKSTFEVLMDEWDEDIRLFNSASVDEQVDIILLEIANRTLRQLELKIKLRSSPVNSWEKSLELMFLQAHFLHSTKIC